MVELVTPDHVHKWEDEPQRKVCACGATMTDAEYRNGPLKPPDCTCGTGNVWGYPNGNGHLQGCPYRLAMARRDAERKAAIS